jgi:hypothetical protein
LAEFEEPGEEVCSKKYVARSRQYEEIRGQMSEIRSQKSDDRRELNWELGIRNAE